MKRVTRLSNGDWHPEEIKAAVRMRETNLEQLSLTNGLKSHACRHALRHPHFDGEMAIAELLGLSPRQIWPSRFRQNGERKHDVRSNQPGKSTATDVGTHRQKQEAA
jgi:Ner family transcriptional regulator